MFLSKIGWTNWVANPIKTTCRHKCSWNSKPYCYMFSKNLYNWNKKLYSENPKLDLNCLKTPTKRFINQTIFIGSSTDLFGNWIPDSYLISIFKEIYKIDKTNTIIFLTKNPERYIKFQSWFKSNMICGITIETDLELNRYETKAPSVIERILLLQKKYIHINIMISIEPILTFSRNFAIEILNFKTIPKWIILGFNTSKIQMNYPNKEKIIDFIDIIKTYNETKPKKIEILIKPNLEDEYQIPSNCYPIEV